MLYEDLRIETTAIAEDSIPALDVTDVRYRRHYFLRRSIATLVEFAEALRLLNDCSDFNDVRLGFDEEVIEMWSEGITFFHENETFLERIRNDTGGHFDHRLRPTPLRTKCGGSWENAGRGRGSNNSSSVCR